jgi:hypothetical protein
LRVSLKKTEDYVKCQEDGKETMESLSERYNRLLTDYNLSASYEVLDKSNREQVEATKARISELESQYKSAASKKIVTKSKRKRRR